MCKTGSLSFVNSINARTISKENTATDQLRRWAVLMDTGAITSVASREHFSDFTHIQLKPLRPQDPQSITAVNGEEINIYGTKQVTLVQDNLAIPATFIISDVNGAILGLDTITRNKLQLRVAGYSGYLARDYAEVKLDYIGNHFYLKAYLKATIFEGLYDYVSCTPDFEDWSLVLQLV
eukprot:4696022-Amphidinium_carterae.1